jgi:hypothetical protein
MPGSDVIKTTVAAVTAELLRRGIGADEPVSIIIEPVEGLAFAWRKSRGVLSPPVLPMLISTD